MKVLKSMMFFMAVATMPLLTSCGKDDGGDKTTSDVAGTYKGKMAVMGSKSDATAELKKTGDNYSLLLKDLTLNVGSPIEIGNVTITDIKNNDGKLSSGNVQSIPVTLPDDLAVMFGGENKITVKVSFVEGTVSGNNLKFKLSVNVPVPMDVPVDFDGNK